jgi:hypothetical protein
MLIFSLNASAGNPLMRRFTISRFGLSTVPSFEFRASGTLKRTDQKPSPLPAPTFASGGDTRATVNMLKLNKQAMEQIEDQFPGVTKQIMRFENATVPICSHCGSEATAEVNVGMTGRAMAIASGTSKFTIVPSGPKPGAYWCRACFQFFDLRKSN